MGPPPENTNPVIDTVETFGDMLFGMVTYFKRRQWM